MTACGGWEASKDKEPPLAGGCLPFQKRARERREASEPVFLESSQPGRGAEEEEAPGWNAGQGRTGAEGSSPGSRVSHPLCSGPTVLEMFNTLLRQLRLSIDYALTGSYDGAISLGTKIIKEHEERMFQEAVIKTIGRPRDRA